MLWRECQKSCKNRDDGRTTRHLSPAKVLVPLLKSFSVSCIKPLEVYLRELESGSLQEIPQAVQAVVGAARIGRVESRVGFNRVNGSAQPLNQATGIERCWKGHGADGHVGSRRGVESGGGGLAARSK